MSKTTKFDNELRGALFKNTEKRDGKKDPDYRGKIQIAGRVFWLDCWINQAKDGSKYMAITATPKDPPHEARKAQSRPAAQDFDDDIPF